MTEYEGRRIAARDLHAVTLGRTTAEEVERLFGAPAARESDGALTYRYGVVHRVARRVGPWTMPLSTGRTEHHTVVFRFKRGVLTRICRSRSA